MWQTHSLRNHGAQVGRHSRDLGGPGKGEGGIGLGGRARFEHDVFGCLELAAEKPQGISLVLIHWLDSETLSGELFAEAVDWLT